MTLKVSVGGVQKVVAKISVCVGGVWKEVSRAFVWKTHGDPATVGWRQFHVKAGPPPVDPPPPPPDPVPDPPPPPPQLTVGISPPEANGNSKDPGIIYTAYVEVFPAGGVPPYYYQWLHLSWGGLHYLPGITDPNSKLTRFSLRIDDDWETYYASFRCIVYDSTSASVSVDVNAKFVVSTRIPHGGGGGGIIP